MAHRFKREKADAFARLFSSKSELPPEIVDTLFFGEPGIEWQDCIIFRSRNCRRFFKELDGSKATGHGKISAAILKRLHDVLAMSFTKICRRLFFEGCWPNVWKYHLVVSIFKRGAAFKLGNCIQALCSSIVFCPCVQSLPC